jgi:hypothetical protein
MTDKTVVDIKRTEEATGTVWLVDGTRLLVRCIVVGVRRIEGETHPDGSAMYEVASNTIITTKPPRN